jgi:hypothetical protein
MSRALSLCAPILLGLALYRRRHWILRLQPIIDPAGAIWRSEPFRHDALAAKRARLLEDNAAISREMLVEGNAVASVVEKKMGERALAVFERLLAEIEAVELDQIEGAEHGHVVAVAITKEFEDRESLAIDDNGLPSTTQDRAGKAATAAVIFGKRLVKS